MNEKISALCAKCNKATQKIYGEYECADCYIEELEDALQAKTSHNSDAIVHLGKEVEFYKQQIEDQAALLSYKVAYEKLVAELVKNK